MTTATTEPPVAVKSAADLWCDRIRAAKVYWNDDFKRARECMEFVGGMQWYDQTTPDSDKYVINLTLRMVNQKVSTLYAKNPKAEMKRRPRLDFAIWDEKMESLVFAVQQLESGMMNPAAQILVADYINGRNFRSLVERVGKTLEVLYALQQDLQDVDFKQSMKQLVRRVIITGVGYVRVDYERKEQLTLSDQSAPLSQRLREISRLTNEFQEGTLTEESPEIVEMAQYAQSLTVDDEPVSERLVFDFPPSTSIIVDPKCRQLKNFVGADWIAQEYLMSIDEVNSFFELRGERAIKPDRDITVVDDKYRRLIVNPTELPIGAPSANSKAHVRLYEVFDKKTRSTFFLVEGYHDFVQPPQPLAIKVKGFWPINAICFNEIDVEDKSDEMRVTCWPPSDVFLWRHPQKEWNRRRNGLAKHRAGASPKIAVAKNVLTDKDKSLLRGIDPDDGISVVELEGVSPSQDLKTVLQVVEHPAISYELYDTTMIQTDMLQSVGEQAADLGQQGKNETATGQSIAAQAKTTAASSNVDDIDDLLSWMAQTGSSILLDHSSQEYVQELVGPGATWPMVGSDRFKSVVYLDIKAASSGRPNKALHVANVRELFPILMQLGANPAFLVREGLRAYDEQINVDEAFPLLPPDLGRPQFGMNQAAMASTIPQSQAPNAASEVPLANAQPTQSLPPGGIPSPTVVS